VRALVTPTDQDGSEQFVDVPVGLIDRRRRSHAGRRGLDLYPCMLEIPTRSTSPEDLDGDRRVNRLIHRSHPTTAAATFNVPALATDSTLYFSFSYFVDDARLHTVSTSFAADMAYAPLPQIGRRHLYPRCFACLRILDPELRLKEFAYSAECLFAFAGTLQGVADDAVGDHLDPRSLFLGVVVQDAPEGGVRRGINPRLLRAREGRQHSHHHLLHDGSHVDRRAFALQGRVQRKGAQAQERYRPHRLAQCALSDRQLHTVRKRTAKAGQQKCSQLFPTGVADVEREGQARYRPRECRREQLALGRSSVTVVGGMDLRLAFKVLLCRDEIVGRAGRQVGRRDVEVRGKKVQRVPYRVDRFFRAQRTVQMTRAPTPLSKVEQCRQRGADDRLWIRQHRRCLPDAAAIRPGRVLHGLTEGEPHVVQDGDIFHVVEIEARRRCRSRVAGPWRVSRLRR